MNPTDRPVFRLHKGYLLFAAALFLIEVLIALFLHDRFIRPYVGDFLVVIFLYCLVRGFMQVPVLPLATAVFVFAVFIEIMQYFRMVDRLGLQNSELARVILGSSFEWADLLAYLLGIVLVIIVEKRRKGIS